jgi:hypothetical protein
MRLVGCSTVANMKKPVEKLHGFSDSMHGGHAGGEGREGR